MLLKGTLMKVFDLHCDTLYKAVTMSHGFSCSDFEVQTNADFEKYLQCFAVWIPDDITINEGRELFKNAKTKLKTECELNNIKIIYSFKEIKKELLNHNKLAMLTLENCSIINNDISYIKYLADSGVKIATLTWNASNCIGDGAMVKNSSGLTEFGREAVSELERQGIVIDLSHASDKLFFDVCETAKKPFIASHSNSRKITNHKRNLTDEQAKIIFAGGGIVGLNFHNAFLNDTPENAGIDDIIKHAEHFLSLGGENNLALGSDFDGGILPYDIESNLTLYKIYNRFLQKKYQQAIIDKIFYENAVNFFENFDI